MTAQELDGLLAAHFAGTLDAEGQRLLGDALVADESARRRFVELSDQDAALRTLKGAEAQTLDAGRKEAQKAQMDDREGLSPHSFTHCASCASLRQPSDRSLSKPKTESPKPKAGRSGWLLPAVAAAALIVVSGLFASGILPSGSVTIKDFESYENRSGHVVEEKLADGTRLAIAPGARIVAAGRDPARKVRQLIKLESGEVEVRAPKAVAGETACRVETPEGLWVETVGTVFKVTRAWENKKGERNMDRLKLAGLATAVLLVAVAEGEVRVGRGLAEEVRVGEGGEARVAAPLGADADPVLARIDKALARKVSVEFVAKPLKDCFAYLRDQTNINLVLHEDLGDPPVTLRLADVPLGTVLDWLLQVCGLKREYRNEAIHILPRGKGESGPALIRDEEFVKLFEEKTAKEVRFEFAGAFPPEAVDFLRNVSELNVVVDPAYKTERVINLRSEATPVTVKEALDKVLEQARLKREFGKSALYLTMMYTPDEDVARKLAEEWMKANHKQTLEATQSVEVEDRGDFWLVRFLLKLPPSPAGYPTVRVSKANGKVEWVPGA